MLLDPRYPGVQRYLRRVYVDQMTGSQDWVLISAPDGGISGVHSAFPGKPLKSGNFPAGDDDFKDKDSYAGWKFVYALPDIAAETAPAGAEHPAGSGPAMSAGAPAGQ